VKTPEEIEAELKLQSELAIAEAEAKAEAEKAEAEEKAAAFQAKIEAAGELHFVHSDRVYVPAMPKVHIPGLGVRTALEICIDEEAQEYLVKSGCEGTVIKEIL
jgi:hypothetical protein